MNAMIASDLTEEQIRIEARKKSNPAAKRIAAERILRSMEYGDLSDFSGLLKGEHNLEDLRAMGINTEVVKKFKRRVRTERAGEGDRVEEIVETDIELHDRAGEDFDRIMDRTEGSPRASLELNGGPGMTPVMRALQDLAHDLAGRDQGQNNEPADGS
jgi:hypothetical protein